MLEPQKILNLFAGKPKKVGKRAQLTAMLKESAESLTILKNSIPGDQVADLKYHGGDDRVIHHYSIENYEHLKASFPKIAHKFNPGSYGENITTSFLTEEDLCIGDIFKLGTATIQISEARKPCGTIDNCYEEVGILKEILNSKKYGWLYRVLEQGEVKVGDELIHLERLHPNFPLDKVIHQIYHARDDKDLDYLQALAKCPELSARVREYIATKHLN